MIALGVAMASAVVVYSDIAATVTDDGVRVAFHRKGPERGTPPFKRWLDDCQHGGTVVELLRGKKEVKLDPSAVGDGVCGEADDAVLIRWQSIHLPPGTHEVTVRVSASNEPPYYTGTPTTIEVPPIKVLRLKIGVAIDRSIFDQQNVAAVATAGMSSLWKKPQLCPNLKWSLVIGEPIVLEGNLRKCTFTASWPLSAEARIKPGDKMKLWISDDRSGALLGHFEWTLETFNEVLAAKKKLKDNKVDALDLRGTTLRDAPAKK